VFPGLCNREQQQAGRRDSLELMNVLAVIDAATRKTEKKG
jgi:hypothetical protein